MIHLDLFSGIGGFSLAVDRVWGDVEHTFCEIDPFCRAILKKHWPDSIIYEDIKKLTYSTEPRLEGRESESIRSKRCYILTGGVPCQPASQAGRRKGTEDDRWLWPETFRIIRETAPTWCVLENVRGLLSLEQGVVFKELCAELEGYDYEVWPFIIPACAVGAPHRRDRVWIVAHAKGKRSGGSTSQERGASERLVESDKLQRSTLWREGEGRVGNTFANAGHERQKKSEVKTMGSEQLCGRAAVANAGRSYQGSKEKPKRTSGDSSGQCEWDWNEDWPTVAQRFCRVYDGVPYRLVGFTLVETRAMMGYILLIRDYFYGTKAQRNTDKILSAMREKNGAERLSKLARRYDTFSEPKVLRCSVHGKSNDEREGNAEAVSRKSEKIQKKEMREVWHEKLAAYPPYQRGLERQCSCQFDDIVRELSSPFALADWHEDAKKAINTLFRMWKKSGGVGILSEPLQTLQEVWRSVTDQEIGRWRSHYYLQDNNRNAAIKAYGNAIVPAVAVEIFKAIKEYDQVPQQKD